MNIELLNGRRLTKNQDWQAFKNLRIQDGKILEIDGESEFEADYSQDVNEAYVLPGLVDLCASLREPGFHTKGSIASETKAAAAGGVTTVCCSPSTDPVNDSEAVTKLITELAHESNHCEVLPLGALTAGLKGEQLSEYAALKEAGCIALSSTYHPTKTLSITQKCFAYAKTHGLSVFVNPIEPSLYKGAMHSGIMSTTIGLKGIPSLAETIAVGQLIALAKATGVHLHLSQLSAKDSVKQLAQAKQEGANITADVALHNLIFTDEDLVNFNSQFHCHPPLRGQEDRQALIDGVNSGVIDCVTSQHQPHEAAAKLLPFAESATGISGIELLLPIALEMSERKDISLTTFVDSMTRRARKVLSLEDSSIAPGESANLCVFDPKKEWTVTEQSLFSQGKNTPYLGKTIHGKVVATVYEGRLSHQEN